MGQKSKLLSSFWSETVFKLQVPVTLTLKLLVPDQNIHLYKKLFHSLIFKPLCLCICKLLIENHSIYRPTDWHVALLKLNMIKMFLNLIQFGNNNNAFIVYLHVLIAKTKRKKDNIIASY